MERNKDTNIKTSYDLAKSLYYMGFKIPKHPKGLLLVKDITHPDAYPRYYLPTFEELTIWVINKNLERRYQSLCKKKQIKQK